MLLNLYLQGWKYDPFGIYKPSKKKRAKHKEHLKNSISKNSRSICEWNEQTSLILLAAREPSNTFHSMKRMKRHLQRIFCAHSQIFHKVNKQSSKKNAVTICKNINIPTCIFRKLPEVEGRDISSQDTQLAESFGQSCKQALLCLCELSTIPGSYLWRGL